MVDSYEKRQVFNNGIGETVRKVKNDIFNDLDKNPQLLHLLTRKMSVFQTRIMEQLKIEYKVKTLDGWKEFKNDGWR